MKKIKNFSVSDIKPYDGSHKTDKAIEQIKTSLLQFGFQQPIIVDKDNVIVAGNALYKAAVELAYDEVPVMVADDLTEDEINQYRIADNQTSSFARWNESKLKKELSYMDDVNALQFCFDESLTRMLGVAEQEVMDSIAKIDLSKHKDAGEEQIVYQAPTPQTAIPTPEQKEKEEKKDKAFRDQLKNVEESLKPHVREYFTFRCGKCNREVTVKVR